MFNDRWIALAIRYGHESFMRKFAQKENKGIMFQIMNMVNYPRMMAYFNFYMPIYLIAQLAFGTSLIPFQTKLSFNMGRHEFDFFNQDINLVSIFGATSIVRMMMMRYLHNAAAANAGVPAHIAKMQHGHQYLNLYRLHQEFIKNSPKAGNVQGEEFKTTAQPVGYMGDMSSQNLNNWKMYSNWKKQQGDTNDAFHMGWVRTNLQLTSLLQGELILNLLRSEGPGYTDLVNFGLLSYWLHDWHYNLDLADQMSQGGAEKRVRIYGVEYERNQQLFGIQGPTRQYSSVLPSLGILSIVSLVGATMPLAALVAGNITFNIALNLFISKLKKELNHEVKSQAGKDAIVGVASVVLAAGAETIAAGFGIIPILGPIISPFVAPTTALWLKSLFIQNASATTWELYANIPKGKTIKALIKYATNKTFKLGAPEKVHLANAYPFNKQNERSPFPALDSRIQTDRSLSKIASFMRSSATKQKTMTLSLKEQAWVDFMQENPDLSTELMGKDYKLNSQEKVVRSLAKLKKVLLASQDDINKIVEITLLLQRGNTDTTESELSNAMSRFAEMVKDDKDRSLITDQKALADYLHEHKDYDLADFFYKQLEFLNQDPVENYKNRVDMYKELNQPFKASLVRPKLNKRRNDLSRTQ